MPFRMNAHQMELEATAWCCYVLTRQQTVFPPQKIVVFFALILSNISAATNDKQTNENTRKAKVQLT